ncbi:MAG: hypothetical protein PVG07_03550 [Acidobacteriota bacterium]|jgi:hypothetical protein
MPSTRSIFKLQLDPAQRRILLVCGVVILACVAILAVDELVVDDVADVPRPPRAQRLAEVAQELGLELQLDQPAGHPADEELIRTVEPFTPLVEPADDVGAVMSRETAGYRLWAYEHRYEAPVAGSRASQHGTEVELPEAPAPDFGAVDTIVEESGLRQDALVEELERELEELGADQDRTPEERP